MQAQLRLLLCMDGAATSPGPEALLTELAQLAPRPGWGVRA